MKIGIRTVQSPSVASFLSVAPLARVLSAFVRRDGLCITDYSVRPRAPRQSLRQDTREASGARRGWYPRFDGTQSASLLASLPNQRIELTPGGAPCRSAIVAVAGAVHARRYA